MTITVELPPEIEARLRAQAKQRGMTVTAFVQEFLARSTQLSIRPELSSEAINRIFDEAADLVPEDVPPLTDEAMSRESIYSREDEW